MTLPGQEVPSWGTSINGTEVSAVINKPTGPLGCIAWPILLRVTEPPQDPGPMESRLRLYGRS